MNEANTEIVHLLPLNTVMELQKVSTVGEAATVILKAIAVTVRDSLGKPESAELSNHLDKWVKSLNTCDEILKKSLKKVCVENGEVVSDAGSRRLVMGGYEIPVTAKNKDSYDDKKIEALVRANGFNPDAVMDVSKSYSFNKDKFPPVLLPGLESCKKEVSYALMPLRKVNNND